MMKELKANNSILLCSRAGHVVPTATMDLGAHWLWNTLCSLCFEVVSLECGGAMVCFFLVPFNIKENKHNSLINPPSATTACRFLWINTGRKGRWRTDGWTMSWLQKYINTEIAFLLVYFIYIADYMARQWFNVFPWLRYWVLYTNHVVIRCLPIHRNHK